MLGTSWAAKTGLQKLNPDQAKELYSYANFRRTTIENVNRLLNEISGAAVSPQEAERLRASQPDAGTGIFDGDDPISFQAKLNGVVADQKRAIARYNFLRQHGPAGKAPWDVMPLEGIDDVIRQRGAQLQQQIQQANPNASPAVIEQDVKSRLGKEFGIAI